jgi:hypothetical protein
MEPYQSCIQMIFKELYLKSCGWRGRLSIWYLRHGVPLLLIDPVWKRLLTLIKRSCNCPVGLYGFGMDVNVCTRYFFPRIGVQCGPRVAGDRRHNVT